MNIAIIVGGAVVALVAIFGISLAVSNRKASKAATEKEKANQLEEAAEAGERQDAEFRKARGSLLDRLRRIAGRVQE
jgi:hypothetical protein